MWQQHATMDDMPTPVERGHRQLGGRTDLSVGFMCMFHVSMFRGFVIVRDDWLSRIELLARSSCRPGRTRRLEGVRRWRRPR